MSRNQDVDDDETRAGPSTGDIPTPTTMGAEYMRVKKDKLLVQIRAQPGTVVSRIFDGVKVFVNGYTNPSALELRFILEAHGGVYHLYLERSATTHIVATQWAAGTAHRTKNWTVVKPEWIVESVIAGRRLDEREFLLFRQTAPEKRHNQNKEIVDFFTKKSKPNAEEASTSTETTVSPSKRAEDARDPRFIQQYYDQSRLHLISTMAQEFKDLVRGWRMDGGVQPEKTSTSEQRRRVVFHVDMDCFFVSVALRSRPELRGQPVAVAHSRRAGFSEIASCSYEARQRGVHNGQLVQRAIASCPTLRCVPYEFDAYREVARKVYEIVARKTLEIRAVSCDELFVDVSELVTTEEEGGQLAEQLRHEIEQETGGCTASVGIGSSMLIARLATRRAKPNGVHFVPSHLETDFIRNAPASELPGLGRTMLTALIERFGQEEVKTCGRLRALSKTEVAQVLGPKVAEKILDMADGRDDRPVVETDAIRKSVSCDVNYGIRFEQESDATRFVENLARQVHEKLERAALVAGQLSLRLLIRAPDAPVETEKFLGHGRCVSTSKSASLGAKQTSNPEIIVKTALQLLRKLKPKVVDMRGVAIQLTKLAPFGGTTKPSESTFTTKRGKIVKRTGRRNYGDGEDGEEEDDEEGGEDFAAPITMTEKAEKEQWRLFALQERRKCNRELRMQIDDLLNGPAARCTTDVIDRWPLGVNNERELWRKMQELHENDTSEQVLGELLLFGAELLDRRDWRRLRRTEDELGALEATAQRRQSPLHWAFVYARKQLRALVNAKMDEIGMKRL